jgi:hypothetical protein
MQKHQKVKLEKHGKISTAHYRSCSLCAEVTRFGNHTKNLHASKLEKGTTVTEG